MDNKTKRFTQKKNRRHSTNFLQCDNRRHSQIN